MQLVVVKLDGDLTRIEEQGYFDDPGPGMVTLRPGDTMSGKISLKNRFPGLEDLSKEKKDAIIFWSYELRSNDGESIESMGRVNGGTYVRLKGDPE